MVEACWACTSRWAPPTSFRWCLRPYNITESRLIGHLSMRLATPGIVARCMCRRGPRRSSRRGISLPPSLPSLLLENHVAH